MGIEQPKKGENKKKLKQEESLGDYKPVVDNLIFSEQLTELRHKKEGLDKNYLEVKEKENVADYFLKESQLPAIKEHIEYLQSEIEKAIGEAASKVSKEALDLMIDQLRDYESTLEKLEQELSERHNTDTNIKSALEEMSQLESNIKVTENQMKKIVKLYESNQEKESPNDITTSLN